MNGHVFQGVVSVLCMYNMRVMCVVGWNGDVGSLFMVNMISCTTFRKRRNGDHGGGRKRRGEGFRGGGGERNVQDMVRSRLNMHMTCHVLAWLTTRTIMLNMASADNHSLPGIPCEACTGRPILSAQSGGSVEVRWNNAHCPT